jgi:hypothetical protein
MANRSVDAAAHARAVNVRLSSGSRDLTSVSELRARAQRYRLLSETLLNPAVIEVVLACARELEARATSIELSEMAFRS